MMFLTLQNNNFLFFFLVPFVNLNAPLKIVNGAITSSNLIGAFSSSISVDAFNAFEVVGLSIVLIVNQGRF